jgi:hypothetical protein
MNIINALTEAKSGHERSNEDVIAINDEFVFVFDGATHKTHGTFAGVRGGQFAARVLGAVVRDLPADVSLAGCVATLTDALEEARSTAAGAPDLPDRPSAVFIAYSAARREVWRVGDCSWMTPERVSIGRKAIDTVTSRARAAYLRSLLAQGIDIGVLRESDPGRELVIPLLRQQHVFRNRTADRQFGFGAIDGTPVPRRFAQVAAVAAGTQLVLATDGYPRLFMTLEASEAYLAHEIERDPLRIWRHPATNGVAPADRSYDDRAYVLLRT